MSDEIWSKWKNKRYESGTENGYWRVIGYIDRPALILQNPITGQQYTEVIDSHNHLERKELTKGEALEILEANNLCNKPEFIG